MLRTRWLSFADLLLLEQVEDCVDTFYNCGRYRTAIGYLEQLLESPFALYCQLGDALAEEPALSREGKHAFLWRFGRGRPGVDEQRLREALRLDWLCCEKPRKRLPFLDDSSLTPRYRRAVGDLLGDGEKVAAICPPTWVSTPATSPAPPTWRCLPTTPSPAPPDRWPSPLTTVGGISGAALAGRWSPWRGLLAQLPKNPA